VSELTREGLWAKLRERELVGGELPAPEADRSPWFVRVMLGVAGWIGALFLLGFVGIALERLIESPPASLTAGALACAAAAAIFRARDSDLVTQFAFAVSLAGQALMANGWFDLVGSSSAAALVVGAQQAALFFLLPNFNHRVWASWSGAYAVVFALGKLGLAALAPALATAAFLAVWLREFDHPRQGRLLRSGGYGLAIAAVQAAVMQGPLTHVLLWGGTAGGDRVAMWIGAAAAGAVLLWAVLALLRREGVALASGPGKSALAGAAILAVASLKAAGIGPATAILLVGYANGNRLLAGLGIAALIGYLSHYYYSLQATLLEKSVLLAAAGLALIAARLALAKLRPETGNKRHA
jgi:hypothetical protein